MTYINFVDGQQGSGKTSFISLIVYYLKTMCPKSTVWSNYGLRGSRHFSSFEDFQHVASLDSSIIGLDEAHLTLDSRQFASKNSIHTTELMYYLRKLRVTLFMTSVSLNSIDSRVREIVDLYIYAQKQRGYHFYTFFDHQSGKRLRQVQIHEDKMKRILNALDLYKTWLPVRSSKLPKDFDFDAFLDSLIATNMEYYQKKYGSFEGSMPAPWALAGTQKIVG